MIRVGQILQLQKLMLLGTKWRQWMGQLPGD